MKTTKSLPELIEELVEISWQLEKLKYNSPNRATGWIASTWILGYGLDGGWGKNEIKAMFEKRIAEYQAELDEKMSELSAKVEV